MRSRQATDSGTLAGNPPALARGSGNRCGHHPGFPRIATFTEDRRPQILHDVALRMEEWYFKPDILPALRDVNSDTRRYRSEGREACYLLITLLIWYTDLRTLRVQRNVDNELGLDYEWCAGRLGISIGRVQAASTALQRAGLLKLRRKPIRTADGGMCSDPAVKQITPRLFVALGLASKFRNSQKRAEKRYKSLNRQLKNERPSSDQELANLANLSLLLDKPKRAKHPSPSPVPAPVASKRSSELFPFALPRPDETDFEAYCDRTRAQHAEPIEAYALFKAWHQKRPPPD